MKTYYRKAWDIIGWTYHAEVHCKECGETLPEIDPEGNERKPVFVSELEQCCYSDDPDGSPVYYSCASCDETAEKW